MPDINFLEETIRSMRSNLEREKERIEQANEQQEALETLLKQYKKQADELQRVTEERDALKAENEQFKMQQKELDQMSKKLVQKAEHEDLLKVVRTFMNVSRRKNVKKRGYIKMTILELMQVARLTLPEDMQKELENFDDDNLGTPAIGEYVATKIVENEIQNVEAGGSGVVKHSQKE